jgi:hypothetical protein
MNRRKKISLRMNDLYIELFPLDSIFGNMLLIIWTLKILYSLTRFLKVIIGKDSNSTNGNNMHTYTYEYYWFFQSCMLISKTTMD